MKSLLEKTKDILFKEVHWTIKARAITNYHKEMVKSIPRYSYASTARDLGVSRAYISENIRLYNSLETNRDWIHMSRKKAIEFLRSIS